MPSIVTHNLFAEEVLKRLSTEGTIKFKNKENIYYIFAQSFDNLFYYKFLTPWIGKNIRKFGEEAQKINVNLYFKNIINYIDTTSKDNKEELIAFLYGSICHYVLDSTCHPYIFSKSGNVHIDKKYRGCHEKMEVNIDAYMYQYKKKKELKDESLANILLPKEIFSKEFINALNTIYRKTFQIENLGVIYQNSVLSGNFLLKFFVTDKNGIKKKIYAIKDFLTFWSNRKYQYLSFHVKNLNEDYLNENKAFWTYPENKSLIHNESFLELYDISLVKCVYIINSIENYWKNKISKEKLLKIIGNNSYASGIDCKINN